MNDKDFELQWKDEQIAELRSALSGTITETGSYNPLEGKKAEKAMKLLEKEGFEGMLVVEQSGLRFDQLLIGEKLIQL